MPEKGLETNQFDLESKQSEFEDSSAAESTKVSRKLLSYTKYLFTKQNVLSILLNVLLLTILTSIDTIKTFVPTTIRGALAVSITWTKLIVIATLGLTLLTNIFNFISAYKDLKKSYENLGDILEKELPDNLKIDNKVIKKLFILLTVIGLATGIGAVLIPSISFIFYIAFFVVSALVNGGLIPYLNAKNAAVREFKEKYDSTKSKDLKDTKESLESAEEKIASLTAQLTEKEAKLKSLIAELAEARKKLEYKNKPNEAFQDKNASLQAENSINKKADAEETVANLEKAQKLSNEESVIAFSEKEEKLSQQKNGAHISKEERLRSNSSSFPNLANLDSFPPILGQLKERAVSVDFLSKK